MRIIFDVNVLIRACLGSTSINELLGKCILSGHQFLQSDELIRELAQTSKKSRLTQRIDWNAYNDILALLDGESERVQLTPPFPACRDERDRYLLALADTGNANFLVTNDQDLLILKSIGACRIVSSNEFATILTRLA